MSTEPIETSLRLLFTADDTDVTESLMPDLLSFSYSDKETNEADEISITLKDPTGKWASAWKPDGGESVRAFISKGTTSDKGINRKELYCGRFFVDSMRVSGSPRVFDLRAVSIPLNKPIRKKIKSFAWEGGHLSEIAEAIAAAAGVEFSFYADEDPYYDRVDQTRESDLKFLSRLCQDVGLSIKVTDEKLVIFDQHFYENRPPVKTITLGQSDVLSWDFEIVQSETYKSVTVIWRDPKKKKRKEAAKHTFDGNYSIDSEDGPTSDSTETVTPVNPEYNIDSDGTKEKKNSAVNEFTYTDPEADENGQEFVLKKRAKSIEEAERLAKAKLRLLNQRRVTGNLTVIGDLALTAGVVVTCKGFGSFDGNFYVEQATHSISTSGYTTSISVRRVNNEY